MKKIYLLSVMLLTLAWCGQNNVQQSVSTNTQSKQNIQSEQNNLSEQINKQAEQAVKNVKPSSQQVKNTQKTIVEKGKDIENTSDNLAQIESKKIEKITNLKSGLYFYWLDCKKLFKLSENIKKCEMWWLKEAGYSCIDKKYFKNMTVEQIFNKKKFDLIDDTTIQKYKNICLQQLNEIKKQEEKAQQEMQKEEQLRKQIKAFTISDCEKLANKQKFEDVTLPNWKILKANEQKEEFIQRCKIGYAIKYKRNCSILNWTLKQTCEKVKKDLDFYKRLKEEENTHDQFDLRKLLDPNFNSPDKMPRF